MVLPGHTLPSLHPLPPLQMPDDSTFPHKLTPNHQVEDSISLLQSPAPSVASGTSFLTAYTSSPQGDTESPQPRSSASSLAPPQNLRKSLSVDSFVKLGRDAHTSAGPRPNRGDTGSALDPPRGFVFDMSTGLKKERQQHAQAERGRGASISSTGGDNDSAYIVDSDAERSDPLSSPVERYRHASLKGQEHPRPSVRGGELPLPSRTPTLSSTSSISSMMSASTNSSTLEGMPRLHSASSLQSLPRRVVAPTISPASGRTRSGSLGVYAPSASRRIPANAHHDTFNSNLPVTLLVVGTLGCGKSVAIRKGLKFYGLSEPGAYFPAASSYEGTSSLRYTRRIGRITRNEDASDCPLHVIEVAIPNTAPGTEGSVWPKGLPRIDGVIICYDSSDGLSFRPVEGLLRECTLMKLPGVVLACKSDLERQVEPERALEVLQQYDVGLVEVANAQDAGREKMRRSFDWLCKAIFRERGTARNDQDTNYRNPASPGVLSSPPPWENSRTATPTAPSLSANVQDKATPSRSPHPPSSVSPIPPTRTRSAGDLLYENERVKTRPWHADPDVAISKSMTRRDQPSSESVHELRASAGDLSIGVPEAPESQKEVKPKEPRPAQWVTLDGLLEKLLFLTVSADDPAYITHFLLTYRRFASPRNVLLAMQKRMRQLDDPSGDPMFSCFAQMRICHLLELWIQDYPYDFSVRGTAGALSALVKSIISKTYLLHYGSEFLPFLEMLPNLVDQDSAWALKVEDSGDESDESCDDEADCTGSSSSTPDFVKVKAIAPLSPPPSRERKTSSRLPNALIIASGSTIGAGQPDFVDLSPKQQIKDLVKLAQEVLTLDPDEIAQEITRVEVKLFLEIQPRHWLHYTLVSGKKDSETEPISAFNAVSNHLANWVVSLILCHDRPRARAKQIEKFVEIAQKLRALNNYSALRAFVAGINNATFAGDETMEQFKMRFPEHAKNLQSWDVLLQHIRSHRAYRLALRNTKGACIPALEVHMSDLIRAHEGNEDINSADPTKIHWGKFNMMGRFINQTTQCQAQCRISTDYNFPSRSAIAELFVKRPLMDDELQKSRIAPPDEVGYQQAPTHSQPNQPRDVAILRKLFFW